MGIEVDGLIFLLSANPPRLIPCKVIEQIVSKKSNGTSTTHIISTPSDKTYTLEKMRQPWFSSLDDAEKYLIDQAKEIVNNAIEKAKVDSNQFFSVSEEKTSFEVGELESVSEQHQHQPVLPENETTIMLENGVKARVILPDELK